MRSSGSCPAAPRSSRSGSTGSSPASAHHGQPRALCVLLITVVPLAIGMVIRARRTAWAQANENRAKVVAFGAFVGVILAATLTEFETLSDNFADLALATLTLNLLAMGCSFAIARLARIDLRQATAVALELGVHNGTVAIAVGTLITDDVAVPAIVYGVFMYLTAGIFAKALHRRNAAAEALPAPAA